MMQQDYEHSEQIQDLMEALARAQGQMKNPITDSTGPHPKSRYASLAVVRDAVMPALAAEGIALTQLPLTSETHVGCVTILWHKAQYLKSTLRLPVAKADPHAYGSALTYARRYSLLAICNVAADDDDDGNQGRETGWKREPPPSRAERPETRTPRPEPVRVSSEDPQRKALISEIEALYKEAIAPLRHPGMYKAIYYHSFQVESPGYLQAQPLEVLSVGMALYRHLTAQLVAWDRKVTPEPEDWIAQQKQMFAHPALSSTAIPQGVDLLTGEELRDISDAMLLAEERQQLREQREREEAALLERAQS